MDKIIVTEYVSPCGVLVIGACGDALCLCDWVERRNHSALVARVCGRLGVRVGEGTSACVAKAASMLDEYFAGMRFDFDLDLLCVGTEFQKRVWRRLMSIPYGHVLTYGSLARAIGLDKGARAVSNAVGANPLSIFLPCHRVVGVDGTLTGYAGGLDAKRFLLDLESSSDRVGMFESVGL